MTTPSAFPLSYVGQQAVTYVEKDYPPSSRNLSYPVPTLWLDRAAQQAYIQIDKRGGQAIWVLFANAGGVVSDFSTDSGTASPTNGIVNISGTSAQGIQTSASGDTITVDVLDATTSQKGVLATASDAQAVARTSTANAVTPSNLTAVLASPPTIGATAPGIVNATQFTIGGTADPGTYISVKNSGGTGDTYCVLDINGSAGYSGYYMSDSADATRNWGIVRIGGSNNFSIINNNSQKLALDTSGNLTVSGLTFDGTNTIQNFEVGTFSAVVSGGTVPGTGTYNSDSQYGFYTRLANRVTVDIWLSWSAHTGSGEARFFLPFTVKNIPNNCPCGTVGTDFTLSPGYTSVTANAISNTNYAVISQFGGGSPGTVSLPAVGQARIQMSFEI